MFDLKGFASGYRDFGHP